MKIKLYLLRSFCIGIFIVFAGLLTMPVHANEFKVGFAELSITPDLIDKWVDINLSLIHI